MKEEKVEYLDKAARLNFFTTMDKIPAIYKSWGKKITLQEFTLLITTRLKILGKKQPYYFDWRTKNYQVSKIVIILLTTMKST